VDDLNTYIESGILEAYVNGMLSEEESKEVDRMAQAHPEVRTELEEIRAALTAYHQITHASSPPSLDTVMSQIHTLRSPSNILDEKDIDTKKDPNKTLRYLIATALILLIISVAINLILLMQNNRLDQRLLSLQQDQQYLLDRYTTTTQSPEYIDKAVLDEISSLHFTQMLNIAGDDTLIATAYWYPDSAQTYIGDIQLPQIPDSATYQLWAFIEGVPISAGVFYNDPRLQKLNRVTGTIEAFAITREPKGGSTVPTLDNLLMEGKVRPSS